MALASLAIAALGACASKAGIVLPRAVDGIPSDAAARQVNAARQACAGVASFSAEIAVSGRLGRERVRGRLLVGASTGGRIRLEALAPFGQPVFVLVASGVRGTVLLPRERKVVSDVPADELLEAMTGLRVDGSDLGALLTGCVVSGSAVSGGRDLGDGWSSAVLGDRRATAYSRRSAADPATRVLAARLSPTAGGSGALTIGYERFGADGLPRGVRLERSPPADALTLSLTLSQVDVNVSLDDAVFAVTVPPEFVSVPLDEVRRSGPLTARQ
jgi:outer membrane lipoprotein-sorting protein